MKRFFKVLLLMALPLMAMAQPGAPQMPPLPVDPAVRIGKLDNGLTYYIRHNEYPKGQAEFYIAQKVGSILEEDNQRGLAHFLEHMCFNGTKHFPGNNIVSWCESVGVKFGRDLNAYTAVDRTVYNISSVPTARESVQDSCLLILRDWADDLLLEDEEIDKERSVIHEEWRSRISGTQRIIEKIMPKIYPDSKYGYRFPIGTMEVIDNFKYQALRDYYEKWYRPDLQGILVVGDIDVDRIEAKIKEMFSSIKMPENAAVREYFPVADNKETIVAIGTDKEQNMPLVMIYNKYDATPNEVKSQIPYYAEILIKQLITQMFSQRLNDILSKADSPFAVAQASDGDFLLAQTKAAFDLTGVSKGNDIRPAIEALYRELLRAKRGGFTVGEYTRAKNEMLSRFENTYNNRNQIESHRMVTEYVEHFLCNEPIPGIEIEYQLAQQFLQVLPLEAINMSFNEMIQDGNRVVCIFLPEKEGFVVPTEQEITDLLKKVEGEDIAPYVDEMKAEPLIEKEPEMGRIISQSYPDNFDATEFVLSNGAKVIIKKTDFKSDEITFEAIAKHGYSVENVADANSIAYLPAAMANYGLGSYTNNDLQKYLAGKQANISFDIDAFTTSLEGKTTPKDLPTLMELIYMAFVAPNLDAEEFEATRNMYLGVFQNQESSPQFQYSKFLRESLYDSPIAKTTLCSEVIKNANREKILEIVKKKFANAGDFTFVFSGNIDPEQVKPLLLQYIASIPGKETEKKALAVTGAFDIKSGTETSTTTYKMETPQSFAAVYVTGKMDYTDKNHKLANMAGQILSARLVEKVREEAGAVYSISAFGALSRVSEKNVTMGTSFPAKPELVNTALDIIKQQFEDMAKNVTNTELDKVKEFMIKQITEQKVVNSTWSSLICAYQLKDVDTLQGAEKVINEITVDDIKEFVSNLLKQNNYRVVILNPEM